MAGVAYASLRDLARGSPQGCAAAKGNARWPRAALGHRASPAAKIRKTPDDGEQQKRRFVHPPGTRKEEGNRGRRGTGRERRRMREQPDKLASEVARSSQLTGPEIKHAGREPARWSASRGHTCRPRSTQRHHDVDGDVYDFYTMLERNWLALCTARS